MKKELVWLGLIFTACSSLWSVQEKTMPGNYDFMCLGPEGKICKLDQANLKLIVGDTEYKVNDPNINSISYDGKNWWYVTFYHILKRGSIINEILTCNGPSITLLPDLEALEMLIFQGKVYVLGTSSLRVFDLSGTELEGERRDLNKIKGLKISHQMNDDWGMCLAVDNDQIYILTKFGKLIIYDRKNPQSKPTLFRLPKMLKKGRIPLVMEVGDNHLAVGVENLQPAVEIFDLRKRVKTSDSELSYFAWGLPEDWQANGIVWQNGVFRTMLTNFHNKVHKIVDYPIVE